MKTRNSSIQNLHHLFLSGLDIVEYIGLLIIGFATTYAIGLEVMSMWRLGTVTLSDLLLMFLYLEVLAMIGVYFRTGIGKRMCILVYLRSMIAIKHSVLRSNKSNLPA